LGSRMMSTDQAPTLVIRDLLAGYGGAPILQGVSLELWPGEITALLGANGAGKSTLLRAVCGAVEVAGHVELGNARLVGRSTAQIARMGVGHVPEGRGTFVDLTVDENLRVGAFARASRCGLEHAINRVYTWLPRLAERQAQRAGSLSGGEQQMLAIGRALVAEPKVLLLDEPSFGLAPRVTEEVMRLLHRLQLETAMAILLVEQNATAALRIAKFAYVLHGGRITACGSAGEIKNNEALRKAYLGGVS
jgi:branched-chain amino acid transport system ATP-binding protein